MRATNTEPNPPLDHHYLPKFYLAQWADQDGCITRFTRERGKIHARRVFPTSAGFREGLYSLPLHTDRWAAQRLETHFFQQVDNEASPVLKKLMALEKVEEVAERSAWARFLRSLLLRTPAQISFLASRLREMILADPSSRADYEQTRIDGEPATFDQWLESRGEDSFALAARAMLPELIDSYDTGAAINQMVWAVTVLDDPALTLLTSDASVRMSNGHFAIPIGPCHLFLATANRQIMDGILSFPRKRIFKTINKIAVAGAREQVIARDERQRAFIEKHFATYPARLLGGPET